MKSIGQETLNSKLVINKHQQNFVSYSQHHTTCYIMSNVSYRGESSRLHGGKCLLSAISLAEDCPVEWKAWSGQGYQPLLWHT